jgi:hypothetical protein
MAVSPAIQAHFDKTKAYIDAIDLSIDGVKGDITELNKTIAALQASAGQITPEDQALLDQAEVLGNAAAAKLKGVDDLTPPPAPPSA